MKTISPETWKTVLRVVHEHAAARKMNHVKRTWISEPIKLGGPKTKVIINPTVKDTENNIGPDIEPKNAADTLKRKVTSTVSEAYALHNKMLISNYLEGNKEYEIHRRRILPKIFLW